MFYGCSSLVSIDLSSINTSKVKDMEFVFGRCSSLTSLNLSNFDTSNVEVMADMFHECASLTSLDISNFDTKKVIWMNGMFIYCFKLQKLNLSNFNTENVEYMGWMFNFCESLTSLDISNFNTEKVKETKHMFSDCHSLISLDLSHFNTSSVVDMGYMFNACYNLTFLNLNCFDTSNVVNMEHMFLRCSSLASLDLYNFDASKVTDMCGMFSHCYSISSLILPIFHSSELLNTNCLFEFCYSLESLDLSHFNTSLVKDMGGMFSGCYNLTSINFDNFDTSNVINMGYMFNNCLKLKSLNLNSFNTKNVNNMIGLFNNCNSLILLDLTNFDTSLVTDMSGMFNACYNLTYLNITNFSTSLVTNMAGMFSDCLLLKSLDLSNFNTSNVEDMNHMFLRCTSLPLIDLSNFNSSKVTNMRGTFAHCYSAKSIILPIFYASVVFDIGYMFHKCHSLESLDFSNFNTSLVIYMGGLFAECSNLTSINFINFDTSLVENMEYMFHKCTSLRYIDITNFSTSNVKIVEGMFMGCMSLSSLDLSSFDTSLVTNMKFMFNDCRELKSLNLNNFNTSLIQNMEGMFYQCHKLESLDVSKFSTSNVITMKNMFQRCLSLTSIDLSNFDISKVVHMDYLFYGCSGLKHIYLKNLFIIENINVSNFISDDLINPIICIDNIQSLNKIISSSKCPFDNCYEIFADYINNTFDEKNITCLNGCLLIKYDEECYQICSYYFYFDKDLNKYLCTPELKCPENYSKLISEKKECVEASYEPTENTYYFPTCTKEKPFFNFNILNCVSECSIKERQNCLCITNYISNNKKENFEIFDKIINQIRYELTNNFDITVIKGLPIKEAESQIIITTTNNQIDNGNTIYLNLSSCEEKLKDIYKLQKNETIYLLRIDTEQEGMKTPSFEYELYYQIKTNNLQKLNLSYCIGIKADIIIPVNLTDDLDKYNSSSGYYNDICYTTDSNYGTDITLSDRKHEFVDNNMSICEINCDFISYNYETKKAVCSCDIKIEIPFMENIKFDKNVLLNSFTDIKNIANIKILNCYKTVFQKKMIIKNVGCYIYSSLFLISLICFFIFIIKDFKKIFKEINNIKLNILHFNKSENIVNVVKNDINNYNHINEDKIDLDKNKAKSNMRKIKSVKNLDLKNKKIKTKKKRKSFNIINNKHSPPKKSKIINFKENNINNNQIKIKKKSIININNNRKENKNSNNNSNLPILNENKKNNKRKSKIKKESKFNFNHSELNSLIYEEAIIYDKRTCIQYYISLLKIKHIILFIFNKEDYNSRIIKLSIFIFNLANYIFVNGLFFSDSTMHKIYTDHGSYNIIYQLPQIIYSSLISGILNALIKLLGLSESSIIKFKKVKVDLKNKFKSLVIMIKIKFVIFFLIKFSFLIFFWYYITCFCGVYRNTQIHLMKDSLISFSTSLIIPFALYLIPGIVRIISINNKNKYLYEFSKILQLI